MHNFTPVFAPLTGASLCLAAELTFMVLTQLPATGSKIKDVEFLGQATFPTGTQFKGTEVGGLSGITYDSSKDIYYSISDDRSEKSPARFYTLRIVKVLISQESHHSQITLAGYALLTSDRVFQLD